MEKRERKIPLSVKIGYGATGYAALFTFTIVITYGMYFFTDVAGIPATFAGAVSYTHLDVYKRQALIRRFCSSQPETASRIG